MTYFLDFDRTLFDYDTFKEYLASLPEWEHFAKNPIWHAVTDGLSPDLLEKKRRLWAEVDEWYARSGYAFKEGELARFIYTDALTFLKEHGQQSVIVTAGGIEFFYQKDKVRCSGASELVQEVCFVEGRDLSKGSHVAEFSRKYPGPFVFVDDLVRQLDDVIQAVPGISVYEMRRDGKNGSGKYPVLRTFSELR